MAQQLAAYKNDPYLRNPGADKALSDFKNTHKKLVESIVGVSGVISSRISNASVPLARGNRRTMAVR